MASTEIIFAQRLASNERKIRDKAIKKLKKYLEIRSKSKKGFTEEDFLKIWKGLHYCLWMQDKPVIQEELCHKITALVHSLSDHDQTILFIKVFFITEAREWPTIDKWRIDKFMMLIRQFLRQSLQYIQNGGWQDILIQKMSLMLQQTVLNFKSTQTPLGFRSYLNGIFLEELRNTGLVKVNSEKICQFLQPFIKFIAESRQKEVVIDILKKIFDPIINDPVKIFSRVPSHQLNGAVINEWLADKFFALGKSPACSAWHRQLFYDLVRKIRDKQDELLSIPKPDYDMCELQPSADDQSVNSHISGTAGRGGVKEEKQSNRKHNKKADENMVDEIITPLIDAAFKPTSDCIAAKNDCSSKTSTKTLKRKSLVSNDISSSSETPQSPLKKAKLKTMHSSDAVKTVRKFDEVNKTPLAMVDATANKLKCQSVPISKKATKKIHMPCSEKKKVVFNMKKNTALKFKKSMKVSPLPAYSPTKHPEQGILKSPLATFNAQQFKKSPEKSGSKKTVPKVKLFMNKDSRRSSGTAKSTAVPAKLTRSRASDYF